MEAVGPGNAAPSAFVRLKDPGGDPGRTSAGGTAGGKTAPPTKPPESRKSSMDTQGSLTTDNLERFFELERARLAATPSSFMSASGGLMPSRTPGDRRRSAASKSTTKIFDDPSTVMGYASVPLLEIDRLPRGGLSLQTKAVGRIQFGIPPETIKDSMRLGIEVPRVYIVPVERFCREMGPALGINVAEFEFPAYFNFFVRQKRCTLVVESEEAEANIRRVFGETLLGPAQFRNHHLPKPNEEEDFDPRFPVAARPNFYNEFNYFRTQERTDEFDELCLDMLVDFCHYTSRDSPMAVHDKLGVPPAPPTNDILTLYELKNCSNDSPNPDINMTDSSLLSLKFDASFINRHDPNPNPTPLPMKRQTVIKGKRAHETLKERALGRRHTTWLEDSDSDSDSSGESDPGSDGGVCDRNDNANSKVVGGSTDGCETANCRGCGRCQTGVGGGGGDGTGDGASRGIEKRKDGGSSRSVGSKSRLAEGGAERPRLRRVVSNPDLLSKARDFRTNSSQALNSEGAAGNDSDAPKPKARKIIASAEKSSGHMVDGPSWASDGESFFPDSDDAGDQERNSWMYSQAKWLGDVATIYPHSASAEDKALNRGPRVEIFKMTGGTEYIVHDIDENNIIVGKARFSGTVRVPDEIAVEGFIGLQHELMSSEDAGEAEGGNGQGGAATEGHSPAESNVLDRRGQHINIPTTVVPPTFHPPSFGVTVLGNSHGFDKNGSTSGYVLWVNGRGVMIDPPPYSSATLEREGIRPRMIIAIIITHCHADHDAGAFQKVMTGSRVAVITTPTIYKSFIRKYAALSGLSPELLRHSHRHRPAIVGQPLKFQGATFNFTYTLHTIPCIAFKVEWRGRSMVFTGDHMNIPTKIDQLQREGVLTKERADNIRQLPLLDCDLLLHESGAPPIHTPLDVLEALPEKVKKRLFVVHTSALPNECELRVAPTGTAGTIRLDEVHSSAARMPNSDGKLAPTDEGDEVDEYSSAARMPNSDGKLAPQKGGDKVAAMCGWGSSQVLLRGAGAMEGNNGMTAGNAHIFRQLVASLDDGGHPSLTLAGDFVAPIPPHFLSTGEENNDHPEKKVPPLVLLRPTCVSDAWFILNLLSAVPFLSSLSYSNTMEVLETAQVEVFCANEIVIPAHRRCDVLCVVWEGTCIERETNQAGSTQQVERRCDGEIRHHDNLSVWHAGDWTGPKSLQPECALSADCTHRGSVKDIVAVSMQGVKVIVCAMKDLHTILMGGSPLYRKYLAAKEKQGGNLSMKGGRCTEENSEQVQNGWDAENDRTRKKEPSLNFMEIISYNSALGNLTPLQKRHLESLAEGPRYFEAGQLIWQVGAPVDFSFLIVTGTAHFVQRKRKVTMNRRGSTGSIALSERHAYGGYVSGRASFPVVHDKLINVSPNSEYARLEIALQLRVEEFETDAFEHTTDLLPREERMRNARDRFANKVLARLNARHAYTAGIVFSRGHFLSDTSRMVSGSLAFIQGKSSNEFRRDNFHGDSGENHYHTSNIAAGQEGCVVMVFQRESLVSFLDAHPGVLLSLLGTQAVV